MSAAANTLTRVREVCPRCQTRTLHSTGAFWKCETCGLAITQQALKLDRNGSGDPAMGVWRRTGSDGPA